jgi:hypothetical protein
MKYFECPAAGQREEHKVEARGLERELPLCRVRLDLLSLVHEVEEERDEGLVRDATVDQRRPVA